MRISFASGDRRPTLSSLSMAEGDSVFLAETHPALDGILFFERYPSDGEPLPWNGRPRRRSFQRTVDPLVRGIFLFPDMDTFDRCRSRIPAQLHGDRPDLAAVQQLPGRGPVRRPVLFDVDRHFVSSVLVDAVLRSGGTPVFERVEVPGDWEPSLRPRFRVALREFRGSYAFDSTFPFDDILDLQTYLRMKHWTAVVAGDPDPRLGFVAAQGSIRAIPSLTRAYVLAVRTLSRFTGAAVPMPAEDERAAYRLGRRAMWQPLHWTPVGEGRAMRLVNPHALDREEPGRLIEGLRLFGRRVRKTFFEEVAPLALDEGAPVLPGMASRNRAEGYLYLNRFCVGRREKGQEEARELWRFLFSDEPPSLLGKGPEGQFVREEAWEAWMAGISTGGAE